MSGLPGRDLGYGYGSAVQIPFSARSEPSGGGNGGVLKRPLTEMERLQQVQIQHALFLRSVKQRTAAPIDCLPSSYFPRRVEIGAPIGAETKSVAMRSQLEELERRLLLDDDEDCVGGDVSASAASSSALTSNSDWGEAVQNLVTTTSHLPAAQQHLAVNPLSPPATSSPPSSSSTVSSTASCSPPSPAAPTQRQLLLDAAAATADGNVEAATAHLAALNRYASQRCDAEQRLTAMMAAALVARLNPAPQIGSAAHPRAEFRSPEHFVATQRLYELSPPFKLGLIAANYAILDATKGYPKIHILDFEVGQGGHYAAFLQALADRHRSSSGATTSRPPDVKITAVADPTSFYTNTNSNNLRAVGDRIEKVAERFGLSLRFNVVCKRAAELDADTISCDNGEALAVNLAFVLSRVADESVSPANPRDELLRRIRALRPTIVALVEQELNTNTASFAGRFAEVSAHYGAILESLDSPSTRENPDRVWVEKGLTRKAVNSVAREGPDRVERCEVFGKWRARMGMAGFESKPLGPAVVEGARFDSTLSNQGFTVKEQFGGVGLGFGWMGRVLTVASAWR